MISWRDSTSAQCQADLEDLLDEAIQVAAEHIAENYGLTPVGIMVSDQGAKSIVMVDENVAHSSSSSATPLRDEVIARFRASSESIRSCAVVSQVVQEGSSDPILEVLFEHREFAMQVLIPYSMPDPQTFNVGDMRYAQAQHLVWGA
ncbi:MAG: hypothetical protein ACRCSF_13200 [Mycobacteriaceae bacterium]